MNKNQADLTPAFNGSVAVTITKGITAFQLRWNDGVANDWTEDFPTLSAALARAAVLAACQESEWDKGFKGYPRPFAATAAAFVADQIA